MQLFGGAKPAGPATPIQPVQTGNPTDPGNPAALIDPSKQGAGSPLEQFKTLWEAPDPKTIPTPQSLIPTMNVDPAEIVKKAKTVNFGAAISPDKLELAAKGDAQALAHVINEAAQSAYAQGALAAVEISKAGFRHMDTTMQNGYLAGEVRKATIKNEFANDLSPILNNPALLPLVNMMETQFTAKYPNATPAEIKQMASDYMVGAAGEIAKAAGQTLAPSPAAPRKSEDWDAFEKSITGQTALAN
jgi:hypothetical protein